MSAPWKAWFDGACENNPGPGGIGALLVSPTGERFEIAEHIGECTNNIAEYKALISVLNLAKDQGCQNILVHGDSQLVINQVFGTWKVNSDHLRELNREAKALASSFSSCEGKWVRREQNCEADDLSKAGLNAGKKSPRP